MASYFNQVNGLSPRVWYRFNETAGTPSNSGGLTTTATFNGLLLNENSEVDGRSVYFDGDNAYVNINQWPAFSLFDDKSFTIETWFKLGTQDTNNRPIWQFGSFGIDQLTLRSVGTADTTNSGKLYLNIVTIGEATAGDRDMYSTNTYFDSTWHHSVVAVNTTSLKWYIDGQLVHTKTLSTGSLNIDNLSTSPNTYRLIGATRSNTTGNINSLKHKGWIDEFALYGYELSAQQVLDNYNAGASVNFADAPGTASALAVQPSIITDGVHLAAPATASALAGDAYDGTMVDAYIASLAPEQWYKFNTPESIVNYGSGGGLPTAWAFNGDAKTLPQGGIQGSGALELKGEQGHVVQLAFGSTDSISPELTDNEFSIGFWFKADSGYRDKNPDIFYFYNAFNGEQYTIRANNGTGYLLFRRVGSQQHDATVSTNICDGNWHFIYVEASASNNLIKASVDNGTVVSTTTSGSAPTGFQVARFNNQNATGAASTKAYISHFFIDSYGGLSSTDRANLLKADDIVVQATALAVDPIVKFTNKFNQVIESYSPKIDFRFDEGEGVPINYGQAETLSIAKVGTNIAYRDLTTINGYAYEFGNADSYIQGDFAFPAGTFTNSSGKQTISIRFKSNGYKTFDQILASTGQFGFLGTGITLSLKANTGYLEAKLNRGFGPTDTETITYSTNVADNKWYHVVAVKSGSNFTLYVNGAQKAQKTNSAITPSDSGTYAINGEAKYNSQGAATKELYIDEFALIPSGLTGQQVFELWQSLNIDEPFLASNANFPMPTNAVGTGVIIAANTMTADADFINPNIIFPGMIAFADFVHPNFGANVVIDANYGHSAFTADALFHDPQFQIGDEHSADTMDASALFPMPVVITPGRVNANAMVAQDALLVMPGIVTIKGAQVFADPMRAGSLFPLPPAYIQLTDDPWFVRLLEAHADRRTEPVQAIVAAGQQSTDIIKGGFLTFFDDITTDRSPTSSPNTISSEIPAYFFLPVSSTGATDTTKASTTAIAPRQSTSPAPLLAVAGQDNQERKAVRVNNIEFVFPGTNKNFSERYYNVEFSIKTTKADQVLSYGQWESFQNYGSRIGVIGLSDGKIYLATDDSSPLGTTLSDLRRNIPSTAPHPKNKSATNAFNYFQGRNNIADGNWHHVIIQRGWTDGRTQIWVDGALDRQIGVLNELGGSGYASFDGSNGTNEIRPYILGFNSNDPLLYSDFTISAWNFYPGRFLEQRDVNLNYTAYGKWEPIKAEPMTATVTMTANNKAVGNRARALMLYFWPIERQLGTSASLSSTDNGQFGAFDEPTFENFLTNVDRIEYQGWDLFPVSVIGAGKVSPMIKPEVWGGYGYRDQITGAPRYLDLVNDIDLTQFDAIFFRNFPEQTEELDEYVRQEFSDTYFGVKEADLYNNFLTSLRGAVDQGLSLYITNSKLALDLGIVDRVEVVSDISEGELDPSSAYVTSLLPSEAIDEDGVYIDTHRNNRFRVVNTLPGLTDEESYIWSDWMYYQNDDALDFGGANRPYAQVLHRPNGLQVGDTFVNSSATIQATSYEAVPFANVKAGKVITAFANTIKTGNVTTDNPYRNYATVIAVEPGTILNGKAVGGKIFVNFTERLQGSVSQISGNVAQGRRAIYSDRNVTLVDLIQDKWINLAFAQGEITEAKKNELLASPDNLDRKLEEAIADGDTQAIANINQLKYWDSNGIYILASKQILDDITGSGDLSPDSPGRQTLVNKTKKSGDPGTAKVSTFGQWFTFEYSWQYPRLAVATVSMLTRGFRWLSDKVVDDGLVNRVQVMTVSVAEMPMPLVTANKDRSVSAQAMLANATIIHAPGYALADVSVTTLPLLANAQFGEFVKRIAADVMVGSALMKQPRTSAVEEDEVVVYIYHVDPILYLREDIIK